MVETKVQAYFKKVEKYMDIDTEHLIAAEGYKGYLDFKCVESDNTCPTLYVKNKLSVNTGKLHKELDSFKVFAKPTIDGKPTKYMEIDPDYPILINKPNKSGFVLDVGVMEAGGVGPKLEDERLISIYSVYVNKEADLRPFLVAYKEDDVLITTDLAKNYKW